MSSILLGVDSVQYKRRLVRELNKSLDQSGVWYGPYRVQSAKLHNGEIYLKTINRESWLCVNPEGFKDGYGREIVASRSAI